MGARAFIVGLSTYSNPKNNLNGVDRDVSAMVSVLSKFGITDLEIIRNENATSANIKRGLQSLVTNTKADDIRIFYYSGHGASLPPGFVGTDDKDGRDEALVPYECDVSSLIIDNWMSTFLTSIVPKNIRLWSIYDACHSGDMFKAVDIDGIPSPPPAQDKRVFLEDLYFDAPPPRMAVQPPISTKELILDGGLTNTIHFGAAEPQTTALVMDIGGERRSAFTWALEQVAKPGMSVAEFEAAVTAKQKEVTDHHHPQVACNGADKNRLLFQ
jgi:hypothetical protein